MVSPMPIEDTLRHATRTYVRAALELLRASENRIADQSGLLEWTRCGESGFVLEPRRRPWWERELLKQLSDMRAGREYAELVGELERHPTTAALLDQEVGTTSSSRSVERSDLADELVWRMAARGAADEFDDTAFDQEYAEWLSKLSATHIDQVCIVPLLGFSSDTLPIELTSEAAIERICDADLVRLLSSGIAISWRPPLPNGTVFLTAAEAPVGLRIVRHLLRAVGATVSIPASTKHWEETNDLAEAVLVALRLFKSGRVAASGFVEFHEGWPLGASTMFGTLRDFPPPSRPGRLAYNLSISDAHDFAAFFSRFHKAATAAPEVVGFATRRFAYALDRTRAEDQILDLMIAAEALLLTGLNAELSYRLALRGAFFLGHDAASRAQLHAFLANAYDVRSKIAHGTRPKPSKLRRLDGTPCADLPAFVDELAGVVRAALLRAIDHATQHGAFPRGGEFEALIVAGEPHGS